MKVAIMRCVRFTWLMFIAATLVAAMDARAAGWVPRPGIEVSGSYGTVSRVFEDTGRDVFRSTGAARFTRFALGAPGDRNALSTFAAGTLAHVEADLEKQQDGAELAERTDHVLGMDQSEDRRSQHDSCGDLLRY